MQRAEQNMVIYKHIKATLTHYNLQDYTPSILKANFQSSQAPLVLQKFTIRTQYDHQIREKSFQIISVINCYSRNKEEMKATYLVQ